MPISVPFNDLAALHEPLAAELDAAVRAVTESACFIGGAEITAFEAAFADYCGATHCGAVDNGTDAIDLALWALGIEAGIHYPSAIHLQPGKRERYGLQPGLCPIAERAAGRLLSLPVYPGLGDRQIAHVSETVRAPVAA